MAKYLIPSAAVSAVYSIYRSFNNSNKDRIDSIDRAVDSLNSNTNTLEALRFIQASTEDKSFLKLLNPSALGILAQHGSNLCYDVPVVKCERDDEDINFERILNMFDLGDEWNSGLAWLNRVACSEEDLSCPEEWLTRRPSQVERLYQLLKLLFMKTEHAFNSSSISVEVVPFLYILFSQFRETNKDISVLALKTLANIALNGVEYASAIFKSEWLPLLAKLVQHGALLEERLISHKICQNALFTLGVIDYKLRSDVYELFLPDRDPEVDIVMIHGLCGSVSHTWRQKDNSSNIITDCWPKDWLHLDIPQPMRILGIDYPSFLIQFTGTMESLQVRADRFKIQLQAAGVGRRPIIFICHSMGGLLAKRLLLDLPDFTDRTVGILFIATPHRGSPIAAWGYSIFHATEDVRFLQEENPVNRKLSEDFAKISDKIPVIVSMVETKQSSLIGNTKGMIVPTQSAVFEKGAVYHIEEVHHNVCKPSERSSPSYGVILNFLRDSIQEAKKLRI